MGVKQQVNVPLLALAAVLCICAANAQPGAQLEQDCHTKASLRTRLLGLAEVNVLKTSLVPS